LQTAKLKAGACCRLGFSMSDRETETVILPCSHFSMDQIKEMYSLHKQYFENVKIDRFISDFSHKQWCILIIDRKQMIVGYSTIELIFLTVGDRPVLVLFSGDTLVAKEYRSSSGLLSRFVQFSEYLERAWPDHARYWLLITKGYRTYRLLPANYKNFYPTYRAETPQYIQMLMDKICVGKFGDRYFSKNGILRSYNEHDFLRPEFADVPEGRKQNRDVLFFLNANPGYRYGDELVCLTPLEIANLLPASRRRYLKVRWNPAGE
jgi:hypothetical protein